MLKVNDYVSISHSRGLEYIGRHRVEAIDADLAYLDNGDIVINSNEPLFHPIGKGIYADYDSFQRSYKIL